MAGRPPRSRGWLQRLGRLVPRRPPRGSGWLLAAAFLGTTGWYGAETGGQWPVLVARYGTPADIAANLAGFRIETVTITGQHELEDSDILEAAGVHDTSSLLFLDANAAREGLEALPLVREASVRKLFPDTLALRIEERVPYALWQKDGVIQVVAQDGTPIKAGVAEHTTGLPFVVGEDANLHAGEIAAMLASVPDLAKRVRASALVAGRRWNVVFDNGVIARLPEEAPGAALTRLAALEASDHVLEKDVLSIDLRLPDRVAFRLSVDAAAARAAALAKKAPKKGAET